MNKGETKQLIEAVVKDHIDICPHCGTKAHLKMLYNESYYQDRNLIYYIVFTCVPCEKLILKTYLFRQDPYAKEQRLSEEGWQDKFPTKEIAFLNKFEEIVPEDVLSDFKEGVISLQSKCPKAAVGMFRRSLQSTLLDLGADSKQDLIDQIKNLGSLTKDLKDWAHNIRIFGNWGAHPQADNLKDVDSEKAEEAQSFLEEFFNYVYVMPNRVKNARPSEKEETSEEKPKQ